MVAFGDTMPNRLRNLPENLLASPLYAELIIMNNLGDELGPKYVLETFDPKLNFRGVLVIDSLALGVGKGGIRMTPTVTSLEVWRLARAMTLKNALAELPFGGAKAGIVFDPGKASLAQKKAVIESFGRSLKPFCPKYYIAGPDMNTGEKEMEWFANAVGNWHAATGKPTNVCIKLFGDKWERCGIPHEFGSTGFGVAHATRVAADLSGLDIKGAKVAIAGFGNVGTFSFQYLQSMGAKVVAVSDAEGAVFNFQGLDYNELMAQKMKGLSVVRAKGVKVIDREAIYELAVDILIPAAVADVINENNFSKVKAKIIVEGANIPVKEGLEEKLHQKGILVVPDIVANSGGVISSFAEYKGYHQKKMFEIVEKKIVKMTKQVLSEALKRGLAPRQVANSLAYQRVYEKTKK